MSTRRSCWAPSSATTSSSGKGAHLALEFLGRQDVANGNGFLGSLQATYRAPLGENWRVAIGPETSWASDDYMKAYFGVDSADANRSGLDRYNADAGIKDVGLNLVLSYLINPRLGRDRNRHLPSLGWRRRGQPGNRRGLGEPVV